MRVAGQPRWEEDGPFAFFRQSNSNGQKLAECDSFSHDTREPNHNPYDCDLDMG
jgi:hypothetical protein